ncbi:DUF1501 domain-containing protein [Flammeovirgaceae bacterium SG7u.111]|nr:DUF1501 domain-containing protein [Flammeovirgaceae bacterium SG7u.132]WPO36194.1 DUF1501 domain-containing protein [Flammeovirgaceae bacterium SG7u.111]
MHKRRDFLKRSALVTAGSLLAPQFLSAGKMLLGTNYQGKKLVVVQLGGGNDGLNTIVPFRNDIYYKLRPNLSIPASEVLPLNDELGLNPSLKALKKFYDNGELAVLNNVGYPNPDRSHFRSMDIWQSASDSDKYLKTGWLGRMLDATCPSDAGAYFGLEAGEQLSLAMKGERMKGMAVDDVNRLYQSTRDQFLVGASHAHEHHEHQVDYLYKTLQDVKSSAAYLKEKSGLYSSKIDYPKNPLAKELRGVAQLINAGAESKIYYTSISGFDTHARQKGKQGNLLKSVAESLDAFVTDLKVGGQFENSLVMVFSEFGRRVEENGSEGTDHGTANNVWLIGGKLKKAGVLNTAPDLVKLNNDDLIYTEDFRSVYATILNGWLATNSNDVLGGEFSNLGFV